MQTSNSRLRKWVILMVIGMACSAPLDEQKIYFPGENPDDGVQSRNYGLQPSQFRGQDGGQMMEWSQDGVPEVPSLPHQAYTGQTSYSNDYNRQAQESLQPRPGQLEAGQQFAGVQSEPWEGRLPYGSSAGSSFHQSSQSQGAAGHGTTYGGKKVTKHTWTSHYSTSGSGQSHINPQQITNHHHADHESKTGQDHTQLGHTGFHKTSSQELAAILDGSSPSHELHPNIKQAFDNVIRDYGSGEGSHQTVHKISHTKKTTVQNVGREPSHIQSTSSNDDISLSELIEQLQMLEQSPRHVNITWCEEKIKEFLRALRRKQASGVFINQQVQEETLHQVLTHELVESSDSSGGVQEPPFTKVTARPLGSENLTHSQVVSEFIKHEKEHQGKGAGMEVPAGSSSQQEELPNHINHQEQEAGVEVPAEPSQEEQSNNVEQEIITVVPHDAPQLPEIMAHQNEHPKATPPFTSDNSDDLKELELELPEYVPFEHAHSGSVEEFQSNTQRETRPMPHPSSGEAEHVHSEITTGQEMSHKHQDSSNHVISGGDQTSHYEVGSHYHHTQQESGNSIEQSSSAAKEELQSHDSLPEQGGKEASHEYTQIAEESHHTVHGRPEAPLDENSGIQESNQEEKTIHAVHSEQSSQSEEKLDRGQNVMTNLTQDIHSKETHTTNNGYIQNLHKQQLNYDTLIEELIELESIPGHQAIDKCEEKIQEFLEILKYQQEQGFGRNQQELQRLHQTLIEQAQERSKQLTNAGETTLPPTSFWRRVQKKIKNTYQSAKDRAKDVMG